MYYDWLFLITPRFCVRLQLLVPVILALDFVLRLNRDTILFPEELILKYQQHSMSLAVHSCPNFQAPIICFNESLSFSPPAFLSLCLTHIYFFLTLFFFFYLSNSLTGRSLSHIPFLEARQWSTVGVLWQLCELPLCHLWRAAICPRRHAQRSWKWNILLILITVSQSKWFSLLSLWLKSDGSTERNSSGVYQTDERLKTCYCLRKCQACWLCWSCLLIVWNVTEKTTQGYKETAYMYS